MDYLTLLIGLLIGAILGFIGNQLFQKIKAEQKEDNDQDDVISEIKALKQEVKEYNDSANTDRGSINQILTDMRTAEQQVGQAAMEIKRTLVTGGGQKQGAWGQLILEHILENKLQFTKGEEFEVQKSFNTNDATTEEKNQAQMLGFYYYEYFIQRVGSAPFRGSGSSIKKGATDTGNDGMAYRVYACGIRAGEGIDPIVVPLESVVVLPR